MVWITSMVAAGGGIAPAYQWLTTIDEDYGRPLGHWQQFAVVISTQIFGWSLGQGLKRVFVGCRFGDCWPDTLPLSFLIQALFPCSHRANLVNSMTPSVHIRPDGEFHEEPAPNDMAGTKKADIAEKVVCEASDSQESSGSTPYSIRRNTARKRYLAFLALCTFGYQVVVSYIAPVLKSLCLLCLWAPQSKVISQLGSGWNGVGILSLTFDWAALGTLQPLVTPLGAQVHYYIGAALMLYVLTPLGWHLDWWKSAQLPIVSTSVFDINGDIYNVTLVRRATVSGSQFQVAADVMDATMMYFNAYSPVRLAVNSALGYLFSVAAITAAAMHLFLWHPQWLGGAVRDMAQAFMRLWDPRRHFQTRSLKTQWPIGPVHSAQRNNSAAPVSGSDRQQPTNSSDCFAESTATTAIWSTEYALGRAARMLAFVLSLGVALLSSQLGISALPGWQSLLAVVWAAGMCLPIGFVEATTGFTLPMDVLPHVIAGWMQKPGSPIETSYFHLWATAPVRVALGWGGVRSFQLAHHCCQSPSTKQDIDLVNGDKRDVKRQHIHSIPWMNRGLLISLVWGACINHLVYVALSRSQVVPVRELPVLMSPQLPDRTPRIAMPTTPPLVGWQEEGEFGRLPAALSSELVVWGIVGPRSVFAADSPYRLLFAYGSVAGIVFPLLLFLLHVALAWLASATAVSTDLKFPGKYWRPCFSEALRRGAQVARGVQVPVILAGMVAVPAIPANFVVSGLAAAVGGQLWCRYRNRSLADRSLCSAAMDTGTKLAVVVLFVIGQAMVKRHGRLAFVEWWGNQPGNAERCMALQ